MNAAEVAGIGLAPIGSSDGSVRQRDGARIVKLVEVG